MADDFDEAHRERCPKCQGSSQGRRTGIWSNQGYAADSTIWALRCDACGHEWEWISQPGQD